MTYGRAQNASSSVCEGGTSARAVDDSSKLLQRISNEEMTRRGG